MKADKKYKLGIALSGGGARGIAHIGVMQALYENNIKPDIIAGTSAGSIIGAFLADGHTPTEIMDCIIHYGNKFGILKLTRPTISRSAIMKMDGIKKVLEENLKSKTFENLQIPMSIAATDIDKASIEYFTSGKLIPAIIASSSIPVIFKPVKINGCRYIDGGVLSNLPVRAIREHCDKVIAVHVNPIRQSDTPLQGFLQIAEQAFHLAIHANIIEDKNLCDFFIEPNALQPYGVFDVSKLKDIYNAGYNCGLENIKAITKVI